MSTFAIVIPNFNHSHFLFSAFESLRHQSVAFSLAVMDGGSTDNFDEVVGCYSDMINFSRSAKDEGQAAAILEGEKKIEGDIITWLNADDYYFPDALDKVASIFDSNPGLDVVYGNAIHVDSDGFFLSYFPPIQEYDAKRLTFSNYICQPACFVRRTAYDSAGGIDPSLHYTMDWDLWCRLSQNGAKFHYLPEELAAVRYYQGTKTLCGSKRRYREIYRIGRKYGRSLFPVSCLGGYYTDLSFIKERSCTQNFYVGFYDILRKLKKKVFKSLNYKDISNSLIHGFHRWESISEGKCVIHLPWYDRRIWKRLRLKVDPPSIHYRISIEGRECERIFLEEDCLLVDLPMLKEPHRQISIECIVKKQWRLLSFSCLF